MSKLQQAIAAGDSERARDLAREIAAPTTELFRILDGLHLAVMHFVEHRMSEHAHTAAQRLAHIGLELLDDQNHCPKCNGTGRI
jgi:hypothetical protein